MDFKHFTDEQLAQKAPHDPEAFGELIDRWEKPLLSFIGRLVHVPWAAAEEVAREVFLKAWRNINSFDADLKWKSWILRIAHNEAKSMWRKHDARGGGQQLDWDREILEQLPGATSLVDDLDQKITNGEVRNALLLLPHHYKTILVLRFLEEMSYEEISDTLQMPPSTVGTMIRRAKKAFQEIISRTSFFTNSQ